MKRLAAVDWLLLAVSLPIFFFGVVKSAGSGPTHGYGDMPFHASSALDADSYPFVARLTEASTSDQIAAGDHIAAIGDRDTRGWTTAAVVVGMSQQALSLGVFRLTIERAGKRSEVTLPLVPAIPWWMSLPFVFGLVSVAVFLLVRARDWHLARRFYVASLLFAIGATSYFNNPISSPLLLMLDAVLIMPLAFGITVANAFEFAPGKPLRSWWKAVPWLPPLLASCATAAIFWLPDTGIAAILRRSFPLAAIAFAVALITAFARAYRLSDALGRRQLKWIVYGFYVGSVPYAVFQSLAYIAPAWRDIALPIALGAATAVPLGFLIAIAFYQWLDIDRLISATFSYSVLTVAGIAILLAVVPSVASAASGAFGLEARSTEIFLSVAIASGLVPADRFMRPRIDRLLFADRVAREHGLEVILSEVAGCRETQTLTRLLVDRLDTLLRPTSVALYARVGDLFMPLDVRGRSVPPPLPADGELIGALQDRTTPLVAERWTARRATLLSPLERAVLETLDVAVLLPIRRSAVLAAFSCIGPKRSGDIYTPAELALLAALISATSERMLSIDTAAVAEQARTMHEALRRYVPGAIAERIVSGKDVEAGEQDISVLFVDIRGYTGFSERRAAEEIFGTVNQYTEAVSTQVKAHGGTVVEFHGDGMLAVFGAPEPIPDKERAAVQAARGIVDAVAALSGPDGAAPPQLSVGVGIATGSTFVGNIQSVDRLIWTVIGNTPNLAARLQSLTRELDAAVAIDATTYARAAGAATDFVCHAELAIRGRSRPEDVYALPLNGPGR